MAPSKKTSVVPLEMPKAFEEMPCLPTHTLGLTDTGGKARLPTRLEPYSAYSSLDTNPYLCRELSFFDKGLRATLGIQKTLTSSKKQSNAGEQPGNETAVLEQRQEQTS